MDGSAPTDPGVLDTDDILYMHDDVKTVRRSDLEDQMPQPGETRLGLGSDA